MYILDSDFLISAYRHDFPPTSDDNGFWKWLDELGATHTIVIPEKVFEEIGRGTDDLIDLISGFQYIQKESVSSAAPHISSVLTAYGALSEDDLEILNNRADPYLVAHGIGLGGSVVTNEISEPNRTKPLNKKVPDICALMGVKCVRYPRFIWEMQRGVV
jgi:hypothetical protein